MSHADPPVLLTVRGTLVPSSQESARTLHNDTAGSPDGVAAARALGDLSHKVFVAASGAGKHAGVGADELLFLDVWQSPSGIEKFFGDPHVGEQAGRMFKSRDASVWAPARGAFSFHLPAAMTKNDRYVGLVRGVVKSQEAAVDAFRATIAKGLSDARRRGQLSHEIFFKLAPPGAPPELLGVDVWSDFGGMMEHYASLSGYGVAFAGAPSASLWEQAKGVWSEW